MNKSNCFPICDVQEIKCKSESVINKKLNMDANGITSERVIYPETQLLLIMESPNQLIDLYHKPI
jgi:hypothetical protein